MGNKKFDIENFPTSTSAKKMLSYVSDGFYDESYVGKWLFQVMGLEYDTARELAENLPEQFFPETATWGLRYHEQKWHLPIRENLLYEERRKFIFQKRDYRSPMTPFRMEKYLRDTTGLEVYIADVHDPGNYGFVAPHPNIFKVTINEQGTNTNLNYDNLEKIIGHIKQSHTTYSIDHVQHFEYNIGVYAGAIITEWVGYEIKPRQTNRDVDTSVKTKVVVAIDMAIFQEVKNGSQ